MKVMFGFALLFLITGTLVVAQKSDEATRKLWDTAFIAPAAGKTTSRRRSSSKYRVATPNVPIENVVPESVVGVTIWRLRPAGRADAGERIIVHDDNASKEYVPERISPNTKLNAGDRLRISVEAARSGYLYVIDRELYADGTLGEPYLIFPTTRTLNGDNQVSVGKLAEIPAQEDSPPFFTIRRSRPDQVAEVLSVLVTPAPLEGVQISDKAQKLSAAQVAKWEQSWSNSVGRLDMESVGQTWTKVEKEAATNTRALTASAPAPQMLFYRPSLKSNEGMFVKLRLSYRK
ncbi:MAG TPA: hypothetical protein VFI57_05490 [Pyrinomonadaceae bacterium]|jgi:hypothetical protein|nr:hypothetical protein [Pyrinomonadaceae bacterium]